MKIGDKVRVVDKPISLLKWLIRIDGEFWWAKGYDIEVIGQDIT